MAVVDASEIVTWVFGSRFGEAAIPLAILIFASVGQVVLGMAMSILTAVGRPFACLVLTGPLAPLAIVLLGWAIPRWGVTGAAMVMMGLSILASVSALVVVFRCWDVLPSLMTMVRYSMTSLAAFVLASVWPVEGWWLLLKLPALVVVVVITLVMMREFNGHELGVLRSWFRPSRPAAKSCPFAPGRNGPMGIRCLESEMDSAAELRRDPGR